MSSTIRYTGARVIDPATGVDAVQSVVVQDGVVVALGAGWFVRRSLKPLQLPPTTLEYLAPRPRVAYFFEPMAAEPLAA